MNPILKNIKTIRNWFFNPPTATKEFPIGEDALFSLLKVAVGLARHEGIYVSDQNPYDEFRYDPNDLVFVVRRLLPNPEIAGGWIPDTAAGSEDPFENPSVWCGKLEFKAQRHEIDTLWFAPLDGMTHEFMKSAWEWLWQRGLSQQEVDRLSARERLVLTKGDDAACSVVALPLYVFQALVNPTGSLRMPVLTVPEVLEAALPVVDTRQDRSPQARSLAN